MKKLLLTAAILLLSTATAFADGIKTYTISSGTITAGGSYTETTGRNLQRLEGYVSIQIEISGSGTVTAEYLMSNDGTSFMEPDGAADIKTGMTATGGPNSDGKYFIQFAPQFGKYMKIRFTETGGASAATVSASLALR